MKLNNHAMFVCQLHQKKRTKDKDNINHLIIMKDNHYVFVSILFDQFSFGLRSIRPRMHFRPNIALKTIILYSLTSLHKKTIIGTELLQSIAAIAKLLYLNVLHL